VDAKDLIADCDSPIHQRGFLEVTYAVVIKCHPVVTDEHFAGGFRMDCVDVVEKRGREHVADVDARPQEEKDHQRAVAKPRHCRRNDLRLPRCGCKLSLRNGVTHPAGNYTRMRVSSECRKRITNFLATGSRGSTGIAADFRGSKEVGKLRNGNGSQKTPTLRKVRARMGHPRRPSSAQRSFP
jgi:hypothetical protein